MPPLLGVCLVVLGELGVIPNAYARDLRFLPFGRNDTSPQTRYLRYFDLASCSGV